MKRRIFFRSLALGGAGMVFSPIAKAVPVADNKPKTNLKDALAVPRTAHSIPGKYPGKVVKVHHTDCIADGRPSEKIAYEMLKTCMLDLTGTSDLKTAWSQFVGPKDVIGLKVNPIAGKLLSTSHALTKSIVRQLEEAGMSRQQIIIWDRREVDVREAGCTAEQDPGIKIVGTEYQDENGNYVDSEGKLYGEKRVDKSQFFFVDIEGEYDAYTMPYMINGGKYSYFTKICTEMVTKIINVPILKNAGTTITGCMKNLAFGSITNTARLHGQMWNDTCASVCAFPPLRDKVVLNILDGMIGCFDGGPAANPQLICQYNAILVGTDPVAVDEVGYRMILKKRIAEGVQKEEHKGARAFMEMAETLGLGIANPEKIDLPEINLNV